MVTSSTADEDEPVRIATADRAETVDPVGASDEERPARQLSGWWAKFVWGAAIAVALLGGNLAWSFCESSELREVAARVRQRLLPSAG